MTYNISKSATTTLRVYFGHLSGQANGLHERSAARRRAEEGFLIVGNGMIAMAQLPCEAMVQLPLTGWSLGISQTVPA
jgi:hypothetical protein